MTPRQLLLKTADFIEQNPERFDFFNTKIPKNEFTSACAIGWMAFFGGFDGKYGISDDIACEKSVEVKGAIFFDRMYHLRTNWTRNPHEAVYALREYADTYCPNAAIEAPVWAIMRDREARSAYDKFRNSLVLTPRTILPSEKTEEVRQMASGRTVSDPGSGRTLTL